ncbi:MAG TPA: 16S rRNA (guanine(966)-N(2))-methyltransferase RsmD [Isosphaeraceae bacterium]|jgi:16S rRNA (guanine966-N2)-methyltransferase|nr:16S rRNA (guanine(966)-N(2))-methyltransferase RsmD [Isosphaeraceae bacterium]
MRIIAGQRRGHKFDGPAGHHTRPTSDLVRESLFNILGEVVEDRLVIDLFAGTGALGLEALSRGAVRAIFVEKNRANVMLIKRNLVTLRYEDRATVLPTDVFRWVRGFDPIGDEPLVVFIDPPYREYENHPRRVQDLLTELLGKLPQDSVIAVEASRALGADILPEPDTWDVRRYGGTQIAIRMVEKINLEANGQA